ncbi:MAG: DUF1638 domain-containing protein [Myxococcota bacterium]|nr:DUF1638 domain-containing protein [Myxococcota bacterium]
MMKSRLPILLIGCAALAREVTALVQLNGWTHLETEWLPAELHNRPQEIPGAVARCLEEAEGQYAEVLVAYGDCGTGGQLDKLLGERGIRRLPGAHCYAFFAGPGVFDGLHEEELGTFYLTDFLVRNFDRLVIRGLGLDRHPELHGSYFGNYRRVVYLAQTRSDSLLARARECAAQLQLDFELRFTGLEPFASALGISQPGTNSGGGTQ